MKTIGMLLCAFIALHAFPTKRIYFTTNGSSGGAPIIPNFTFNFFWSGSGMGADGCIYMAASNNTETQGGGDVGVAYYNPYTNRMYSSGTVTQAYAAAGNRVGNEYCNKVHTWMCGTPDGKVWFGSEYGGRGGHLLYVDPATHRAVDYSRVQKYIYLSSPVLPVLNHPELPPSSTNGIALQNYSFKINNINPANPRYMWTESYNNYYLHVWDFVTDSSRGFPGGHKDMRAFVVDRQGRLYYGTGTGVVYRRSPWGRLEVVGQGIGYLPNTYCYSHSYDTAYTLHRQQGELAIYDFVNDTVRLLANLPDGSGNNDYRAMAISRDGLKLYVLGNGNVYEVSVLTGAYTNIGSLNGEDGNGYAQSCGLMDTLGNWYITVNGYSGNAYLLQVTLGKDRITQLPFPSTGVERGTVLNKSGSWFSVSPNPFQGAARLTWTANSAFPGFRIYDALGRMVESRPSMAGKTAAPLSPFSWTWNAQGLPPGPYFIVTGEGENKRTRKVVRLP
jgi:hypothetical protein